MEQRGKKTIEIKDRNYKNIAENYSEFYIKDKITKNHLLTNYHLNYRNLIVAMSKNGSLIALCKYQNNLYFGTQSPLNDYLIVMYQHGKDVIKIRNTKLFKERFVVSLEFNYKEQLYAFCDDGEIFKIDILKKRAENLEMTFRKLKNEGILKVKAFEKGFIILTGAGTIFHLKDIKSKDDNTMEFMVSLRDNMNFKIYDDCDFFVIPSTESEENSDIELLVCKPNEEGVFLIKKTKESGSKFVAESKTQNYSDKQVNIFHINSNNIEKFISKDKSMDFEDLEVKLNENSRIGPVSGIAISNSNKKIAIYSAKKKAVYILSSKIPSQGLINFKKFVFNINSLYDVEEEDQDELNEKNNILKFINKQLLFLSDDCVAICGGRWIVLINNQKTYVEDLNIDKSPKDTYKDNPYIYCYGISEVDGIRIMSQEEIILIRKIPEDIKPIFDVFGTGPITPERQLLSSYEKYVAKDPFSDDELREIKQNLPEAIFKLAKASGFLYWVESDEETTEKKDLQSFFLKAANYGKGVFGKAEFNFDRFNNLCMNLRIINALRNCEERPRFLTLEEYENINSDPIDTILKKTMRQLNFKLAFEIAKFLGLPEKDVYLKFAIKKIKKIDIEDTEEVNKVYDDLMPLLNKLENISYIDIAKKCFEYNKFQLGEKFMNNEKSSIVKIPQYLDLRDWNRSIELAIESNDIHAIMVVLDSIYQVEAAKLESKEKKNKVFVKTLAKFPTIKKPVINYLKKNGKMDDLFEYLTMLNDPDELFYLLLEKFFKSESKSEREEIIQQIKSNKPEQLDKKFFENYISDLESSLKFKIGCIEKGVIGKNDTSNADISIFDCFQKAIPNELEWVEKENNKNFKLSKRKLTILRFKELFKKGKISEIEGIIEQGIKKLDISYIKIAMMFLENGKREKAIEYALKENNENLYEDKTNFLIKMEKYEDAAEVAIKIKDNDKFDELFNIIGSKVGKNPEKQKIIQEIYNKRK